MTEEVKYYLNTLRKKMSDVSGKRLSNEEVIEYLIKYYYVYNITDEDYTKYG